MDIDRYFAGVDRLAAEVEQIDADPTIYLNDRKGDGGLADTCAQFRVATLTAVEIDTVTPFLEIGFFNDPAPLRRVAWFTLCTEVIHAIERRRLKRACEPYRPDQLLFAGAPKLFGSIRRREGSGSPDYELVDERAIACIAGSEVFKIDRGFAKLVPYLPARVPTWGRESFGTAPRYLRLDPHRYYDTEPSQSLQEAAIAPASPHWMATTALFRGEKAFAAYILENCNPKDDMAQYGDFHLRGVRRLEVSAQRRASGYLTMMIEELHRADDPNGLMVGRCIHLDTRAEIGTRMAETRLQHLDLAINVYEDGDRALRMASSLQNGRVPDATFRTHLYRIEDIPFPALFGFAERFLASRTLLREWLTDALGAEFASQIALS